MIVISGALVLVALVLLIIGVVGPDLTFVYASIAVSLVSLVFLVVGILQRRGETAPAPEAAAAPTAAPADTAGVTAVVPSQETRARLRKVTQEATEEPAAETAGLPVAAEPSSSGSVLVVQGRPRYHVEGCRYLSGKAAAAVDVQAAREDGYSACGVCKPDEALAAAAQAQPVEQDLADEPAAAQEPVVEEDVPGVDVAPTRAAKKAPSRARTATTAAAKAPARAAVKAAPARPATPAKAPVKAAAAKAPVKAPVKAPAKAPAKAAAPPRAGSVVVIPDRGRFHKADCRFVRDADGTEVMAKAAATRAGYVACGVCKP